MATLSEAERIEAIAERLHAHYGPVATGPTEDPVAVLVRTILSQNTNDANRDRAYAQLVAEFPTFEAMAEASRHALAEAIRPAGMHHQKAQRIQTILRTIRDEQGTFDLAHLRDVSRQDALEALTAFKGIGKKTAGIVLAFGLDKPYFPVDTHIDRITRRLGLVHAGDDPHDVLNALVPDARKLALHIHLIRHGRDTCKARRPRCETCVVADLCPVPREGLPAED